MLLQKSTLNLLLVTGISLLLLNACGTTKLGYEDPHLYDNTYQETITGVDLALQKASMKIMEAEERDNNEYYVKYFLSRFDTDERNLDSAHSAEIIIRKVGENQTMVRVFEEDQPQMMPSEFKQHLARDFYRQLNKILVLHVEEEV